MAVITSLISYWPLNEASGDALDAHSSNNLTDTNTVGAAAGKVSGARDFESGSGELFLLADNAALSTGDIDFSLAAWVNLESKAASQTIVAKGDNGSNGEFFLYYNSGSDVFRLAVASGAGFANITEVSASTFGSPSTATWYFVVAWHDATANTINIQVNDGTADSTGYTFGSYDSALWWSIGSLGFAAQTFDGLIDEVGFWKKVLTAGERTWLYNTGSGRSYADIVAEASGGGVARQRLVDGGLRGGRLIG